MDVVEACAEAILYAGMPSDDYNRRFVEKLDELGFKLVPATNPRPPDSIDAPIPWIRYDRYLYPSVIVPK